MSFSLIVDADTLTAFLESAATIVSEAKVHVSADGLELTAVDPANVGMVDLTLEGGAYEDFDGSGTTIGINLERMLDVLAMADAGEPVELELDSETRKLTVRVGALDATLALIDPDSIRQEPDIPDLDLGGTVVLEGGDVSRMISASDLVSDHIAIGADPGAEVFYAEAEGDTDDVRLEFDRDDVLSAKIDAPDTIQSLFSLDYFKDFKTALPSDAEVSLRIGDDFPTKMRFSRADGDVSVLQMLAPRIQSE